MDVEENNEMNNDLINNEKYNEMDVEESKEIDDNIDINIKNFNISDLNEVFEEDEDDIYNEEKNNDKINLKYINNKLNFVNAILI